jgi:large subunit ribosomal protein L6
MSRIAKQPVEFPDSVEVSIQNDDCIEVKGKKGQLRLNLIDKVSVSIGERSLSVANTSGSKFSRAISGTYRSLISNMVKGVSEGFEKKLELQGVGYRVETQGKKINLTLGFSHPVVYEIPDGIEVQTPSRTEIVISGIDKQKVGQVAAEIRAIRPPEPYKGKGVRYQGEQISLKETKKQII